MRALGCDVRKADVLKLMEQYDVHQVCCHPYSPNL